MELLFPNVHTFGFVSVLDNLLVCTEREGDLSLMCFSGCGGVRSMGAGPYGGGGMDRGSVLGGGGGARRLGCLFVCLFKRGEHFLSLETSVDDRKASEDKSDRFADSAVPPLSV